MCIHRDPEAAAQKRYDLIVLGGGIYGVMLALEASLRGRSVLLLEKEDFGGATSYNSLRIIHGGLRDLQTLNLKRYRVFGRERRWFLEHFPDLVDPLPVLVPLYQRGLLRTDLFRAAFLLDRLLLPQRDREIATARDLPYGKVVSPAAVKRRFPRVDGRGLRGGALWHDACVPDSQRLVVDVLRCACAMGAIALNYVPATDVLCAQGRVTGARGRDVLRGADYDFEAEVVINATGPWSRENARQFDRDVPELYHPSIAWNVLFDREAPSACALGVTPPGKGARTYFLHPWKGRLLAGTGHAPRIERCPDPRPSSDELDRFLRDLNEAIPGLHLTSQDILHVFAGYVPVKQPGTVRFTKEDVLVDHGARGGPAGLYSIGSTKLTAAHDTAEHVMARVFPNGAVDDTRKRTFRELRESKRATEGLFDYHWYPDAGDTSWREDLRRIVREESVIHLDDLVLRRTSLGDNPRRALEMAPALCSLFDWTEARCRTEIGRLEDQFRWIGDAP